MLNKRELQLSLESMRNEFFEAVSKNNRKMQEHMAKEILRLELVLQEEQVKKHMKELQEQVSSEVILNLVAEEVYKQGSLEKSFKKKLTEIYNEGKGASNQLLTDTQRKTILDGIRDRIGVIPDETQIKFISKLNRVQSSQLIRLLKGISFYNQRLKVTKALETLKDREDYAEIIFEVNENIFKKEWFDLNNELLIIADELQPPTDAQVRKIVDVSRYIETHNTLKSEFGIDVNEYEERPEGKLYYTFNWNALKEKVTKCFNKEEASNFIQTYYYVSNIYEPKKLDREQISHLRGLYMQLGEYECTKMTYLMTIQKDTYDIICQQLESRVRYNKIADGVGNMKYREAIYNENNLVKRSKYTRETRSNLLRQEQEEAKELCDFIFGIYSCVGQEVPDEMNRLLPYFIQSTEAKYASVEEQHYDEFRKMVFEQRNIIRKVDPDFNWGQYICNQPLHILKALGLDIMM